jgi:hypothetical protein
MKRIILLFLSVCSFTLVCADTVWVNMDSLFLTDSVLVVDSTMQQDTLPPTILDDMPYAKVFQDSAILHLLDDRSHGRARGEQEQSGFRVQVYASNEPQVARTTALRLKEELSSVVAVAVYELSDPPFWKVRLGDFLTREDALAYKEELIKLLPELQSSTYVVPDKVTVRSQK